jgi:hypothetical protein
MGAAEIRRSMKSMSFSIETPIFIAFATCSVSAAFVGIPGSLLVAAPGEQNLRTSHGGAELGKAPRSRTRTSSGAHSLAARRADARRADPHPLGKGNALTLTSADLIQHVTWPCMTQFRAIGRQRLTVLVIA